MPMRANSDVLSPREFKRQVRRYLTVAALMWLAFSVAGFLFLFHDEVVPGIPVPLLSQWRLLATTALGMAVLSLVSMAWGLVLALPTVGLLALSNADSPFNSRFESSGRKMKRAFLSFLQPVVFLSTQLLFAWLSVAAAPNELRLPGAPFAFVHDWARVVHEIFYSERGEDHGNLWRKAFGGDEPRALVVMLPASVLADSEYLPLVERELGSSIPFFVDSSTTEAHLRKLLMGESAPGDASQQPFPEPASVWKDIPFARELHVALAPELRQVEAAAAPEALDSPARLPGGRISMATFLGMRLLQSQPHLFLLSRWGVPGLIMSGTHWDEVSAEDGAMLRRFLNDAVRSRRESRVRILQFSENDWNVGPFPRLAFRLGADVSTETRRQVVRDLDQILGRGLSALRNQPKLFVAVVPYPDFGSGTPLSRAFVRLPEGMHVPGGLLMARDLAPLLQQVLAGSKSAPFSGPQAPEREVECSGIRLPPGAAFPKGAELRTALWNGILSYLKPTERDVFSIPRDFSAFSADFHTFGTLCRPRFSGAGIPPPSHLALWTDVRPGDRMLPGTLGASLLSPEEATASPADVKPVSRRPSKARKPPPVQAVISGIQAAGRLRLFSVPFRQPSPWLHELNDAEAQAFLGRHGAEVLHGLRAVVHAAEQE